MAAPESDTKPQIVLFGDSLTEWSFYEEDHGTGWYLQKWYEGKVNIVNEGYAGFTSRDVKRPFDRLLPRLTAPSAPPTLLITIFLGANDACLRGDSTNVPLTHFDANIRNFVDAIMSQLPTTKIVLISPPPINLPDPAPKWDGTDDEDDEDEDWDPRKDRGYLTYLSKRTFAERVMQIAGSYATTARVVGVDFWLWCVDAGLKEQGREREVVGNEAGEKYEDVRLPGCGMKSARQFEEGWFTDGLHLGPKAYDLLSKALLETVLEKWPELSPDEI